MSDLDPLENRPPGPRWPYFVIGLSCVLLVLWLKLAGLIISGLIIAAVFGIQKLRPLSPEIVSLHTSIRLSAEEISDIQHSWDVFRTGPDAESLADRTLHRPALADLDCADPEIEKFHFEIANASRFLARLNSRLKSGLSTNQLEALLNVTDARAVELKESWLAARKAAHRLGPDYPLS